MGHAGDGEIEADLDHGLFETKAVFAFVDGVGIGADHFDAVLIQSAGVEEIHGDVKRSLATEGREKGIRLLLDDDFFDDLGRDGLDVGPLGKLRIGHDGGRIGVDQNDLVTLFAKGLTSLGPGVVEFATLSDDNGACSYDENFFDAGVLRHILKRWG